MEMVGKITEIINELKTSPYLVLLGYYDGIRVSAVLRGTTLVLSYTVEPSRRPTREEIVSVFDNMEKYHNELCGKFPEYLMFTAGKMIMYEAVVFSGQMDFTVAIRSERVIQWLVELE